MNRGAARRDIFPDDESREIFLDTLAALPERFGVSIHGYALMPNHYHLVVVSTRGELWRAMRHVGAEFTRRVHLRTGEDGPLFRGRYRNRIVYTDEYWRHLLVYVHLNPVRAGLSPPNVADWTSHRAYVGEALRPAWLSTADLQASFGSPAEYRRYYDSVREGREVPLKDFDAGNLWAPHSTAIIDAPVVPLRIWAIADAVEAVAHVTGVSDEAVLLRKRGRSGNPVGWLAAWWMSRGCGVDNGRIAAVFAVPHSTITRRIARVEHLIDTDAGWRAWAEQLRKWVKGTS